MPLKPIFDKAPLMSLNSQPLHAGLVRSESAAIHKLYAMTSHADDVFMLEGLFRLACLVTAKPCDEPVAGKIRKLLAGQKADGSFDGSYKTGIAILRAAWALYEFETSKTLLEPIARWCAYAAQHWDALMADKEIRIFSADLLELLENLYRVTGKASVLTLCERINSQTTGWSGVLNTVNSQRPTSRAMTQQEIASGIEKEAGDENGYYHHMLRVNHAESLADGARSTMAKGWYSGSATELNATHNGWERLVKYHGAVCGGLTSDELLEGTSPAELISTAALGAWAEALCAAALGDHADWAWSALERMAHNAMPACLEDGQVAQFQRVNQPMGMQHEAACFYLKENHQERSAARLVRGYAALAHSAVTACPGGAAVNMYIPGRYAVPMDAGMMILMVSASTTEARVTIHCKDAIKASVSLRVPHWSQNTEITVNGAASDEDVKDNQMTLERTWHDGDCIVVTFEQRVRVLEGHHQGKYVLCGPVLMVLSDAQWRMALVSARMDENRVLATLEQVADWKDKNGLPWDVPVLPETDGEQVVRNLTPYSKTRQRMALFAGRKQA